MATLGVSIVNGIAVQSQANIGSLPLLFSGFNPSAFDPAAQLSTINVSKTVMTYGGSGRLQTINDTLAPTAPTANIMGGTLPNYFVTGGSQVTQFNTGDNPNWQPGWSSQFESVTTSYGSNQQILEQMFLAGPGDHYRVLDNVFNPYTGALWEQYRTSAPPGANGAFVTGNEDITEFNTGDNPNWDYHHWGNNAQVTVTWQDYYARGITTPPPASAGLPSSQANGPSVTVSPPSTASPPLTAAPRVSATDTTTGQPLFVGAHPYAGPVSGLQEEYVNITSDSLNISVATDNWFIHTGSGTDAIATHGGFNVLDGGGGSNFLTGGAGINTFFLDDRIATADIWSSVTDFHAGDAATVWGVTLQDFALAWVDGQGAAGFTGLTMHAAAAAGPTASLTLSGYSQADLNNGRLSVGFGTDPGSGSAFMYIRANG